ncbi:hypothetical protein AB0D46_27110 [Streptomyces sp. NPDC048383]
MVFRRCTVCGRIGIVREDHVVRVFCDAALPHQWTIETENSPWNA